MFGVNVGMNMGIMTPGLSMGLGMNIGMGDPFMASGAFATSCCGMGAASMMSPMEAWDASLLFMAFPALI